ncbi:MAG: ferritin-like domain-containing protein [Anaerolineae bacterium]
MTTTPVDEALTALQQAIGLEKSGQEFYRKAAGRTANPKGAAMFRSLADDEVLHEGILRRQLDALKSGAGWVLPEGVGRPARNLPVTLFPEGEESLRKAVRPDANDEDALLFALQIENESFNLYRRLAQVTADPNGKRTYEYLAGAEQGHFNVLMLNYEHLTTTGRWPD